MITEKMIERLAALSKVGFGYDLKPEDREALTAAVAALSASPSGVVKPLEWDDKSDWLSTAQTDFVSCYSIWSSEDHWVCSLIDGIFLSRELAKAAARRTLEGGQGE